MNDLFADLPEGAPPQPGQPEPAREGLQVPLAEAMRPHNIDQVIGQKHLLGPGKPLRMAFARHRAHSMILWGPPGVGKTTLARLMAGAFDLDFIAISAVLGGVKDIREAIERAKATQAQSARSTLVFVDEVHRFNKAQQDAFLPHVESGLFVFVGATTENPSFEVVGALLSRAAVYVLEPLSGEDLAELIESARQRFYPQLHIDDGRAPDAHRPGRRRRPPPAQRARGRGHRGAGPARADRRGFLARDPAGDAAPLRQGRG